MKLSRRVLPLLLALAMLVSVALSGCSGSKPLAQPDEVALASFDLIMKDDATTVVNVLGYENEAAARADLFGGEGIEDIYAPVVDEVLAEFEELGATVSEEDGRLFLDGFLALMSKLELTAEVVEMDEKAKTATVSCTVSTVDLNDAMEEAMSLALTDVSLLEDADALASVMIQTMAGVMAAAEPGEPSAPFDVDFSLELVEANGKVQRAWMPVDAEAFGAAISNAALNM